MPVIAKNHDPIGLNACIQALAEYLRDQGDVSGYALRVARTVVLVPYAHLMPVARASWVRHLGGGFVPRFETTKNWARSLGGFLPDADDLTFDVARDQLTAQALLERAGLGVSGSLMLLLVRRLIEAAWQLASVACAQSPSQRRAWTGRLLAVMNQGLESPLLAQEAALARLALVWAGHSAYATDVLLSDEAATSLDHLVVFDGLQTEPLTETLKTRFSDCLLVMALAQDGYSGVIALHPATSAQDEAERAAACVLRHLQAGRWPLALAATDRLLIRQTSALLAARGVELRDETGWTLSTTRAAAHLMTALQACVWDAASDAVLDWLKNAPAFSDTQVRFLETQLRKTGVHQWHTLPSAWGATLLASKTVVAAQLVSQANALRQTLQAPRHLTQWLRALQEILEASGQWPVLLADAAGAQVLAALQLNNMKEEGTHEWDALPQSARNISLVTFTAWVNEVLESAHFRPDLLGQAQVVVLPLNQLLGRPFAALVLPGCDELHLPAAPPLPGQWSNAQRVALGLPLASVLQVQARAAFSQALQVPHVDLLWRAQDDSGEPALPSPLVQALCLAQPQLLVQDDPRDARVLPTMATLRPKPQAAALLPTRLSASAYEDLRRCPYRFFALRQLGLNEADEIDTPLSKRDFGSWLHAVLSAFQQALCVTPAVPNRVQLIERCAEQTRRNMGLNDAEFLPFSAAWPGVRDGYLAWLAQHENMGHVFAQAEVPYEVSLRHATLVGRIDRVDHSPRPAAGTAYLLDYKTESLQISAQRVKQATEDTQLLFYAALLPDDHLRAAYVNVGEHETKTVEQKQVVPARDLLVQGIVHDLQALASGASLLALGEGSACDFCAARGLCRKDFWGVAAD
jgi:ATP-dependent helicase/nuclease subunit B